MNLLSLMLFLAFTVYLFGKGLTHMVGWMIVVYLISYHGFRLPCLVSTLLGIVSVYVISMVTTKTWEGFENEEEEEEKPKKKKEVPDAAPEKTDTPHVDLGTTILHAYRNLSPEQIGGMRRDTKELMGLQKELMGTLAEMKPAIEQGAQLLGTFSQFFGQNE